MQTAFDRQSDLYAAIGSLIGAALIGYERWKNWEKLTPERKKLLLICLILATAWGLISLCLAFI